MATRCMANWMPLHPASSGAAPDACVDDACAAAASAALWAAAAPLAPMQLLLNCLSHAGQVSDALLGALRGDDATAPGSSAAGGGAGSGGCGEMGGAAGRVLAAHLAALLRCQAAAAAALRLRHPGELQAAGARAAAA